eukprot:6205078-Pleurochrysis_carterae.AAC.2
MRSRTSACARCSPCSRERASATPCPRAQLQTSCALTARPILRRVSQPIMTSRMMENFVLAARIDSLGCSLPPTYMFS